MTGIGFTDHPLSALHPDKFGLTFHKTNPLKNRGYATVEQVAELVAAHQHNPAGSTLATLPGMGPARIRAVCTAIDRWLAEPHAEDLG